MQQDKNPVVGTPESHWGPSDPADQPDRDDILGLPRLVAETWTRLGKDAAPDVVLADLRERGIEVTREQVEQACPPPG